MSRPSPSTGSLCLLAAVVSLASPASSAEVSVPHSTPRIDGLDVLLPIGQETVKLVSRLAYDARGKIVGDGTIDDAAVTALGKIKRRGDAFFVSILYRGVTDPVTMKVEGTVGSGAALVSYDGPKGKVKRVPTPVALAATLGASPGTFDVVGTEDPKGKLAATGRFDSGLGNDPVGEGTLKGKIKKGTKIAFSFKNERQRVTYKGVRQGDFFVGTLKLRSPPARETIKGFLLPVGFLFRFNPTVAVTSLTSERSRVQIKGSSQLNWSISGVPTSVTLDPGAQEQGDLLSTTVVPFAAPPSGVDPRVAFKVSARDLVTATELTRFSRVETLGGGGTDLVTAIAPTADGGLLVAGTFADSLTLGEGGPNAKTLTADGGSDVFLARFAADGGLVFAVRIQSGGGLDAATDVTALPDGGVVIIGSTEGATTFEDALDSANNLPFPGGGGQELFVAGYSGEGRLRFAAFSAGNLDEIGGGAATYPDGGVLVSGSFEDLPGNLVAAYARFVPGGVGTDVETEFNERFDGPGTDRAMAVATFPDGSGVVAGLFEGTVSFGGTALTAAGGADGFVARIDRAGKVTFAHRIGGLGDDSVLAVAAGADGSIAATGSFRGEATVTGASTDATLTAAGGELDDDVFVVRYSARGDVDFAVREGGISVDRGADVALLADGSVAVTGLVSDKLRFGASPAGPPFISAGATDAFLARYDARGVLQHASTAGGTGADVGRAVAALADGTLLTAGAFSAVATFGAGEAGETAVTSRGNSDGFIARHDPVNYRFVEVRPEGLAFASVPGTGLNPNHLGNGVAAASDGTTWVHGSFATELVLRDDPDPARRIALTPGGGQDAFVARVRSDGATDLAIQIGSVGASVTAEGVAALPDGSVVVTGTFKGTVTFAPGVTLATAGGGDVFLARYQSDGSLVFAVRGGSTGPGAETGTGLAFDAAEGDILLTGFIDTDFAADFAGTIGAVTLPARDRGEDLFLARYSVDGSVISVLLVGGEGTEQGTGVAIAPDSSVWVVGQADSDFGPIGFDQGFGGPESLTPSAFGNQGLLAHYSSDGVLITAALLGGPGNERATGVAAASDGSAFVTGRFSGAATFAGPSGPSETITTTGGSDIFVARFLADGSLAFVKRAGGQLNDEGLGIAVTPDGGALVTGRFTFEATFGEGDGQVTIPVTENPRITQHTDAFLARYEPDGALSFVRGTGGGGNDAASGIAALPDGSAVITGVIGTGTAGGRQGPSIVFGAGEANETSFEDLRVSGPIIVVGGGRSLFVAKYFSYATIP